MYYFIANRCADQLEVEQQFAPVEDSSDSSVSWLACAYPNGSCFFPPHISWDEGRVSSRSAAASAAAAGPGLGTETHAQGGIKHAGRERDSNSNHWQKR